MARKKSWIGCEKVFASSVGEKDQAAFFSFSSSELRLRKRSPTGDADAVDNPFLEITAP